MLDPNNPFVEPLSIENKESWGLINGRRGDFSRDEDLYKEMMERSYNYLIEVASGALVRGRLIALREQLGNARGVRFVATSLKTPCQMPSMPMSKTYYQRLQCAGKLEAMSNLIALQKWMEAWSQYCLLLIKSTLYNYANGKDNERLL